MNVFLMHPEHDFDSQRKLPWNEQSLMEDLELETLLMAMSGNDEFIYSMAKTSLLTGMENSRKTLLFRQEVLQDCLQHPELIRELYSISIKAIEHERKSFFGIFRYPSSVINRSLDVLDGFVELLKQIRKIADNNQFLFKSPGFNRFFTMIKSELNDAYFDEIQKHLINLRFKRGALISAELGIGNKGENYTLLKQKVEKQSLWQELLSLRMDRYLITIGERDDRGARALSEIKDRGLNQIADSLGQSVEHILSFFKLMRSELAFYLGCINLVDVIRERKYSYSFPDVLENQNNSLVFEGLYDICLMLSTTDQVVGNELEAINKKLFVITGANQGGKSTYLRSIGVTQLMMQAGMIVPAKSYQSRLFNSLFTHYRREEDESMRSGKLDEELSRMSEIIDRISPGSMILFNESFSATNEREGSEIARQIILSLVEKGIKVFFVTHLTDFALSIYRKASEEIIFLRADRQSDGERTFKIIPGEPLETSFGLDLYYPIFQNQSPPAIASQ